MTSPLRVLYSNWNLSRAKTISSNALLWQGTLKFCVIFPPLLIPPLLTPPFLWISHCFTSLLSYDVLMKGHVWVGMHSACCLLRICLTSTASDNHFCLELYLVIGIGFLPFTGSCWNCTLVWVLPTSECEGEIGSQGMKPFDAMKHEFLSLFQNFCISKEIIFFCIHFLTLFQNQLLIGLISLKQ